MWILAALIIYVAKDNDVINFSIGCCILSREAIKKSIGSFFNTYFNAEEHMNWVMDSSDQFLVDTGMDQ